MILYYDLGQPGGAGEVFSLHSQQIVGSRPCAALVPLDVSPQCSITGLPKAMVCGALSMGYYTLPLTA